MSTDRDLTIVTDDDEARYQRMRDALFDGEYFDDTIPTMVMAALLFIDEDAGVHQDDDRIVMVAGFGMWLPDMVTFLDPVLAQLNHDDDLTPDQEELATIESRLRDWFQIKFELEDVAYPSNIAGKTMWVKLVDDEELGDCFCATVRVADGTIIKLPHQLDSRRF